MDGATEHPRAPRERETYVCPACGRHDRLTELRTEIVGWNVDRMFTDFEGSATEAGDTRFVDDTGGELDLTDLTVELDVETTIGMLCACGWRSLSSDGGDHDPYPALARRVLSFATLYGYDYELFTAAAARADCGSPELIGNVVARQRDVAGDRDTLRARVLDECARVWGERN